MENNISEQIKQFIYNCVVEISDQKYPIHNFYKQVDVLGVDVNIFPMRFNVSIQDTRLTKTIIEYSYYIHQEPDYSIDTEPSEPIVVQAEKVEGTFKNPPINLTVEIPVIKKKKIVTGMLMDSVRETEVVNGSRLKEKIDRYMDELLKMAIHKKTKNTIFLNSYKKQLQWNHS